MSERSIFIAALEKDDSAHRTAFLDQACGDDAALRGRVEKLLHVHFEAGGILGRAPVPMASTESHSSPEGPGTVIGPYKLLQQIGEGGMGIVFMAEQTHPIRRGVALKVIKAGMDTAQVIARFEAERQALALMDHPNIAKVLDVGTTDSSRPYFVMELVKGISITKYCDDNHLTPGERLELFIPLCQAVQHAHQKGIIHRDLKPSNVLVALYDGRPAPKVIDFGVAKATNQKLTEQTMFTQYGQIVGTLEYMSPEQAELNQLDIDTRSDIYSMGVLLYELLTGTTPFARKRLREAAFDEMLRIIREEEPPNPSTRLSTTDELPAIAANRKTEPRKLSGLIRGELDWIVMKALEKDRARRYETANGMAMDIQRYLADEPVLAGAPSSAYRFRKFARRNRVALSTAALVLAALIVGTCVSVWQAVRATSAEDLAQTRLRAETAARDEAVASQKGAEKSRQDEAAQRAMAEERFQLAQDAVNRYLQDVTNDEDLKRADFHKLRKRLLESAVPFFQKLVQQNSGDPKLEAAKGRAHHRLAWVREQLGETEAALADYEQMRAIFSKLAAEFPNAPNYRQDLAGSHNNLGILLKNIGKLGDAEAAYRAALAIREKLAAEFPTVPSYRHDLAGSHNNLGMLIMTLGKQVEAEAAFRAALSVQEKLAAEFPNAGEYRRVLAVSHGGLGNLREWLGKLREAEADYRAALAIEVKLVADFPTLPEYRADLARSHNNLGTLLAKVGKTSEAEAEHNAALAIREKLAADFPTVPENRHDLARSHYRLAGLLAKVGKTSEAEAEYNAALAIQETLFADFPRLPSYRDDLAESHDGLGHLLAKAGKSNEAEAQYKASLAIQETLAADFPTVARYRQNLVSMHVGLGINLENTGKLGDAEAAYRAALAIEEKLAADFPTDPDYRNGRAGTLVNLANLCGKRRDFAAAVPLLEQARPHHQAALAANPTDPTYRLFYRNNLLALITSHLGLGDHARAVTAADEMAEFGYDPVGDAYNAACFLCHCVPLAERDPQLAEDRRKEVAQTYVERGLALLRQAIERGFKDATHIQQDPDLEVLRTHEEYKRLIAELEGQQ